MPVPNPHQRPDAVVPVPNPNAERQSPVRLEDPERQYPTIERVESYYADGPRLYVFAPKAGTSSARKYFYRCERPSYEESFKYSSVTFVVRHPYARLLSAWNHQMQHLPIEELIDTMLDVPFEEQNGHLWPMSFFFHELVPSRIVTLDTLAAELHGFPVENESASDGLKLPGYRRAELDAYLADDWALYEAAE